MEADPPVCTSPTLTPTGGHWNPNRLELLAWLRRNAPSLAELYEGAVNMLFETIMPGRTRFIAHAVREIRNRLPDFISGPKSGSRFEWKKQLDGLTKDWQKAGFSLDGSLPVTSAGGDIPSDSRLSAVPLPPRLFLKIAKVLNEHNSTRETRREAAIRLFESSAPENKQLREALEPIVRQWLDITEWFVKTVHDAGLTDTQHDWEEFKRRFLLFEETLIALLGQFYTTIEGLDEILEDTNS